MRRNRRSKSLVEEQGAIPTVEIARNVQKAAESVMSA